MSLHCPGIVTVTLLLASISCLVSPAHGQDTPSQGSDAGFSEADQAQRRQIFASDRWRETNRILNEWLAVQEVYTEDQVAHLKLDLNARIARMGPRKLEAFLSEMEARLDVLMSPEAEDARQWLGQLIAVARDPERMIGRRRPDVMNMTASEIREELNWLQQHRAGRQQAQAAFDQARSQRVQTAQQVQAARRQSQTSLRDSRTHAAATSFRSPYAPVQDRPNYTDFQSARDLDPIRPYYMVGPWGTPIRWDPMRYDWYWYW